MDLTQSLRADLTRSAFCQENMAALGYQQGCTREFTVVDEIDVETFTQ
jgi:hypothetical protein